MDAAQLGSSHRRHSAHHQRTRGEVAPKHYGHRHAQCHTLALQVLSSGQMARVAHEAFCIRRGLARGKGRTSESDSAVREAIARK
jgi:hypothetical protein